MTLRRKWIGSVKSTWDGEQVVDGLRVQGLSPGSWILRIGKQHFSWQSSSHPQSHSSPASTTPLPQMALWGSINKWGSNKWVLIARSKNRVVLNTICRKTPERRRKSAECPSIFVITFETALLVTSLGAEDAVNALETAGWELVIVSLIAGSGTSEHDVVAIFPTRRAIPVVFWIVLKNDLNKKI